MHIPDGFLSPKVCAVTWLISLCGLGVCLRKVSANLKDKMIPLMGVMSAFLFAAQMLNFPVIGGTSGHLLGGVLASVLLGPYAGAIVLTCILTVQCFIFQDGGLTALGANILNMALIGAMGGYLIYKIISKLFRDNKGIVIGAMIAGWFSVAAAAGFCAIELAFSGISPIKIILLAMAGLHSVIGIAEAVITGIVIEFVLKVRPDLIYNALTGQSLGVRR